MKNMLLVAVFILMEVISFAENSSVSLVKPEDDYHQIITEFFTEISQGKLSSAFSDLLNTNGNMASEQSSVIIGSSMKFEIDMNGVGKYISFDPITDTLVSPHIAYVIGFAVFEKHLVRMEFMFFKPSDKWIFNNFSYNRNVTLEIRNASKQFIYVEQHPESKGQ